MKYKPSRICALILGTIVSGTGIGFAANNILNYQGKAAEEKEAPLEKVEISETEENKGEKLKLKNISKDQNFSLFLTPQIFLNTEEETPFITDENGELLTKIKEYKEKILANLGEKADYRKRSESYKGDLIEDKNCQKIVYYADKTEYDACREEENKSYDDLQKSGKMNDLNVEVKHVGYKIKEVFLDEEENAIIVIGDPYVFNTTETKA